jgi:hypothetical protein
MAYQFAGFFAQPAAVRLDSLPQHAIWRDIDAPFTVVGVRLPSLIGKSPTRADVQALARQPGLPGAECWLYLTYDCFGGEIDFVYGLGSRGGVPFGPVEEDNLGKAEAAYINLMARFGVSAEAAVRFEPCQMQPLVAATGYASGAPRRSRRRRAP